MFSAKGRDMGKRKKGSLKERQVQRIFEAQNVAGGDAITVSAELTKERKGVAAVAEAVWDWLNYRFFTCEHLI